MAVKFLEWLFNKTATEESSGTEIDCRIFIELAQEYALRELAFESCVNLIANAVGKCDFKTYQNHKEVHGAEAYLWNVEPNTNQNSTSFLHKLIARLYTENEVLIISTRWMDGMEHLAIADSFSQTGESPSKPNTYRGVVVGDFTYSKTFREDEVLHLKLNNKDIKKVLDAMYSNYSKMIAASEKAFGYEFGQHWKVHLDRSQQGDAEFEEQFTRMLEQQVKPFLQNNNAVLPEYNGYEWQDVSSGTKSTSRDIRAMYDDIFDFTARAFHIPTVLLSGEIAGTSDAFNRWLTLCIDPLCDQLQEEINRKRYGLKAWQNGNYLRIDTSSLIHFDMFAQANNVDKLVSSGVFTVNMILDAAGIPPIDEPWANEHFITKNYAPVSEVLESVQGGE